MATAGQTLQGLADFLRSYIQLHPDAAFKARDLLDALQCIKEGWDPKDAYEAAMGGVVRRLAVE